MMLIPAPKRSLLALCLALTGISAQVQAQSTISVVVTPHSAPNYFGSPNYNAYEANVMAHLTTGLGGPASAGDRSLAPTAFSLYPSNTVSLVAPTEMIVTGVPSWRGTSDPAAPFANERGNRMHFALSMVGQSSVNQFSLRDVGFEMTGISGSGWNYNYAAFNAYGGSDPDNETLFPVGYNYQPWRVGVQYGLNGVFGGGDDVILQNGQDGATPVNALFYFGVGDAYWADFDCGANPSLCDTAAKRQGLIDTAANTMDANNFYLTGRYYLGGSTVTGLATVVAIPEPSEIAMLLAGLGLVGAVARRRRADSAVC